MGDPHFYPLRPLIAFMTTINGTRVLRVSCTGSYTQGCWYRDFTLTVPGVPFQRYTYTKALLHAMPRKWRIGEGIEHEIVSAIESEYERRAWTEKPKPRSTKAAKGCSARDRKKTYAVKNKAVRLFNHLYNELIRETAHAEGMRCARRYPPSVRWKIYECAAASERFRQLCVAFPVLAARAADSEGDVRSTGLLAIETGKPLKQIAEWFGVPMHIRKLKPIASLFMSENRWPIPECMQFLPRQSLKQQRWLAGLSVVTQYGYTDRLTWFAQKMSLDMKRAALVEQVIQVRDWLGDVTGKARCSWETAVERSNAWHKDVAKRNAERQNKANAEAAAKRLIPFGEPWLEGGKADGFEIVPLLCEQELLDEGTRMHHCVGSYAYHVRNGYCFIYSVRRDDKSIATLEIQRSRAKAITVAQLKAPCNQEPASEVRAAVLRWVGEHTARISSTVGFKFQQVAV